MKFKQNSYINKVMIMGSSVCNLQCEYCYLRDQHKSNTYALLNKEIQKAWLDGTYVKNIKKTFEEIGSNPKIVDSLSIWGGEPLIVINNLIEPMDEILTFFPNIKSIDIPTNFTRISNVVGFANKIEEVKQRNNFNGKVDLHIQLSVDAPPGETHEKGHQSDWNLIRENVETLCRQLSEQPLLEKVQIALEVHATLPFETILEHLNTIDKIKKHCDYFNDFHNYVISTIDKYNLQDRVYQITETSFPHTALPASTTVEDGAEIHKILYLIKYLERNINYTLEGRGTHIYQNNACFGGREEILRTNPVCLESGLMAVTIMHDGSICECPCDYILCYDKYWEWISNNPLTKKEYRECMLKKQFYINPITATQEEKDDFDWYIYEAVRLNTCTAIHLMLNFGLEMAKSGQIDYNYYENPELLLEHLIQFNQEYSCPKDQLVVTGSAYISTPNPIRRYFNGLAYLAENDYKEDIMFEAKGLYKWNNIRKKMVY